MEKAQQQLNLFSSSAANIGLKINVQKTVQMILNPPENFDNKTSLKHSGKNIEKIEDFKYLGFSEGTTEKDLDSRIALTWVTFDNYSDSTKTLTKNSDYTSSTQRRPRYSYLDQISKALYKKVKLDAKEITKLAMTYYANNTLKKPI
ncbi:hypothetical protein HELRODRAFT_162978 [Helobdella robusta]|uniref:Reverse transcriptase domain-containing protein n=1 Tax=Helobdella robusta TaxID=6412 RepID=T1ETH2_HELRO|nr:hypothetical protein HELRODRAFT_162978 [Helobdella robusta]ESN99430.1 hypothetical protein HELRODRAFT_162978 [Helobdella robusta]